MNPTYLLYLLPSVIAVIVSFALTMIVWRRQVESGKTYYAFLMLAVGIWALIYLLEITSATPAIKLFLSNAQYMGIVLVPVLWLAFALDYTQHKRRLTRRNLLTLCLVPFLTVLFVWTNDLHSLMWDNVTIVSNGYISLLTMTNHVWFWVHTAYSYLLIVLGTLLLINALVRSPQIYRNQRIVLLVSIFFPWLGNALTIFRLSPFGDLDLTTFAFSLTGLAMLWGMLRFQLLDLVPVAHEAIIENMRDGVIVLDAQNRIVDLNLAAQQIIGKSASQTIGKPAEQVLSDWQDIVERYRNTMEANAEIEIGTPLAQTFFDVQISPLHDRHNRFLGRMILLHDITERKHAVDALRQLNQELEARVSVRTAALDLELAERKRAEEALQASEKKYHELFQVNKDGIAIFLLNPHGPPSTFVELNDAAPKMLGYTRDEMLKLTPPMLEPHTTQGQMRARQAELKSKGVMNFEAVLRHKNGQPVFTEFTAQLIQYEGKPAIMNIVRDITDHKKAEAQAIQHTERLATLNRIARALGTTLNLDELLEIVHWQITSVIPADAFSVALYDRATAELDYRIRVDREIREPAQRCRLVPGLTESVITSKQPLLIRDFEQEKAHLPPIKLWGTQALPASWLGVPMLLGDNVVGVIALQAYCPNVYGDTERELLSTISDTVAVAIENARLFAAAQRRLEHTEALHAIDTAISGNLDLPGTLGVLLEQVTAQLHVDAADVLVLNPHTQLFDYAGGRGFQTPALVHTHLRLGEGLAGRAALERKTLAVADLNRDMNGLARSPFIQSEGFAMYYGVPLIVKDRVNGVLEIFHRTPIQPDPEWIVFLETLAGQAAIAIDHATLFGDLQHANTELALAYDTTLEGWSSALELREQETAGHSARVVALTLKLSQEFGLCGEQLQHLRRGALLHDIGKMGIPDSVLLKPGTLNEREWEIMRRHPEYAYQLLKPIEYLHPAIDIPYCHHEKWDGTGYPRGLKGEEIPLVARIFAIVDVWDALTSNRPYRQAWPKERALAHIAGQSGQHFDPQVVEIFFKVLKNEL